MKNEDLAAWTPNDLSQIALGAPYQELFWTTKLGVTPFRLRRAIQCVGPSVDAVAGWLRDNPDDDGVATLEGPRRTA